MSRMTDVKGRRKERSAVTFETDERLIITAAALTVNAMKRAGRTLATLAATPQTLVEKIVQQYAVGMQKNQRVKAGDFVSIQPEHVMTHDNTGAVISKFKSIGATKFKNPKQPVFTLDHDVQNTTEKNLQKYKNIENFAKEHGVDFYPAGRGIGHQIVIEEGYAFPGTLTVASDSHSNMYGGIGALGTPIVRTDAAAIWATGRTWWQIPAVARVELRGKLPPGATGKDVITTLCGLFNQDEVLNHAVEFVGDVEHLSVDDRLTIANMTTEWGALAGVFPIDQVVTDWLVERSKNMYSTHPRLNLPRIEAMIEHHLIADSDAHYAKHLTLDLSTVSPYVSGPNSVKVAQPLADLEPQNIKIQKAYLVSCTNARASDLKAAADVFRGRKVADGVEFYFAAASTEVQRDADRAGDWKVLLEAGGRPLPAGCGPCIGKLSSSGLGVGLLQDNEVGISATNRNFKGRMGSPKALAYLSSPGKSINSNKQFHVLIQHLISHIAVVAASAVAGKICSPASLPPLSSTSRVSSSHAFSPAQRPVGTNETVAAPVSLNSAIPSSSASTVPGFEGQFTGELVFADADNLNTDGIYPGKYTYQDDIPKDQMARVAMENYDPAFAGQVKQGDILISGSNFGSGSSREQAATCLKYAGIKLVLASSFSETYKRNALNNALLVLEAPELVARLKKEFSQKVLTRRTGWQATVDLVAGTLKIKNVGDFSIPAVGLAAQELVAEDGLEQWVKNRL
ncbi:hypothetical protein SmJEL517_g02418 [Synchytrium microbalum]|uniref:Homoaconitase, mitochondrial n=1 Tax=Synchytrium microbalum TaxID=1806994 RepID=A0A507CAT7_9FUNG|nr:uncharacterized protein SmJEL517_g02418 [Synchytrium microbalum]TPX35126.1 hypothetical protein SmJEL517_g02418 [Synchytrium microbalum]